MTYEIKGDHFVGGNSRAHSFSLEPLNITTVFNNVYLLTANSESNIFFNGSATNQYINFGDATTYKEGHQYNIMNDSSATVFLRDYTLNVLYELLPNVGVNAILKDNGTPQGFWFISKIAASNVVFDTTNIVGVSGDDFQTFIENYLSIAGLPIVNEVPIGVRNAVNVSYQTQYEFVSGSLEVFLGDLKMKPVLDYAVSGNQQGFGFILDAGNGSRLNRPPTDLEDLLVNYRRRIVY
jgi:hypothetical protein